MCANATVRVLDAHVIDQIAAGEVVERPASVVKELIENGLDADAGHITVDLQDGGLKSIRVVDDGKGMSQADAVACILRHATSKLRGVDDFAALGTLGFRGEALSSIAAVSSLRLLTRARQTASAYSLHVRAGDIVRRGVAAGPVGTCVQVDELFFNQPARQKFMRAAHTEQAHILELCCRTFLGARRGGIVVRHGKRRLLDIVSDAPFTRRLQAALGPQVEAWQHSEASDAEIRVNAYVGVPRVDRAESKSLWLFVNGRFVRDRMLARAVQHAFHDPLRGAAARPVAVVYIDLPPSQIDVNVHPQKTEVRFAQAQVVFRVVVQALCRMQPVSLSCQGATLRAPHAAACVTPAAATPTCGAVSSTPAQLLCLAILHGRFVVSRHEDALLLFDWPTFARSEALAGLNAATVPMQRLILPESFAVTPAQEGVLQGREAALQRLGFVVTAVGPRAWALRAMPEALAEAHPKAVGAAILQSLAIEASSWRAALRHAVAACVPATPQPAQVQARLFVADVAAWLARPPVGLRIVGATELGDLLGLRRRGHASPTTAA